VYSASKSSAFVWKKESGDNRTVNGPRDSSKNGFPDKWVIDFEKAVSDISLFELKYTDVTSLNVSCSCFA